MDQHLDFEALVLYPLDKAPSENGAKTSGRTVWPETGNFQAQRNFVCFNTCSWGIRQEAEGAPRFYPPATRTVGSPCFCPSRAPTWVQVGVR